MHIAPGHAAFVAALCLGLVQPAQAQHRDHGAHGRGGYRGEQGWHGGHWGHGDHDNRFSWWWGTGGGWYAYPAPVYPYPAPYPTYVSPPVRPPVGYWYYCANPPGYYPYVAACWVPWRAVPPH